jgi:hypothetical protein
MGAVFEHLDILIEATKEPAIRASRQEGRCGTGGVIASLLIVLSAIAMDRYFERDQTALNRRSGSLSPVRHA